MIDFLKYIVDIGTDGALQSFVKNNAYLCMAVAGYLSWKYPEAVKAIRDFVKRGIGL